MPEDRRQGRAGTNAMKEASKAFSIGESAAEPPALIKEIIGI